MVAFHKFEITLPVYAGIFCQVKDGVLWSILHMLAIHFRSTGTKSLSIIITFVT